MAQSHTNINTQAMHVFFTSTQNTRILEQMQIIEIDVKFKHFNYSLVLQCMKYV